MKNINIYNLMVESKIQDNIKITKKRFNSVLEDVKEDKDLFENQFSVINEDHNIDCSDVKKGFNTLAKNLKESKALIEEAEKNSREAISKRHKSLSRKLIRSLKRRLNSGSLMSTHFTQLW